MTAIPTAFRDTHSLAAGVQSVAVSQNYSQHQIAINGATGQVTVQVQPTGLDSWYDLTDNTLEQNSLAVFETGSISAIQFTPAVTDVAYTVSVSSY